MRFSLRGRLLVHLFHSIARGNRSGQSLKESAHSKPMVSMAMCDVDGRQFWLQQAQEARHVAGSDSSLAEGFLVN
jgi:hypothetical protein